MRPTRHETADGLRRNNAAPQAFSVNSSDRLSSGRLSADSARNRYSFDPNAQALKRIICQQNSALKSSMPPSKASSRKRLESTNRLPNSGRCCPLVPPRLPPRQKHLPESAGSFLLPLDGV